VSGFWAGVRGVVTTTRRDLAGHDLALASAGATLYAVLAAIPTLLVAIALAGFVVGEGTMAHYGARLTDTIPSALGAGSWVSALFHAGLSLSPLTVVLAVFMGSAYGRGLSRALRRFAPSPELRLPPAWWSRALTLPLLGLAPLLLLALLICVPAISRLQGDGGPAGVIGASYLGLNVIWVITWLPLTWTFRVIAPGRPSWRAALVGGVVTGAFISGFLQGFTLFLSLPIDLSRPFGGLAAVGVTSALILWLWVLHVVFCMGYVLTWNLDRAIGRSD
jgi:membrane protein